MMLGSRIAPSPDQMNSHSRDAVNAGTAPTPVSSMLGNDDRGFWLSNSDPAVRNQSPGGYGLASVTGKRVENPLLDQETVELLSTARSQEDEILLLHRQIADAAAKELQLLNEKHVLEMKLWDLRMALDEKHNSALSDALRDLTNKKAYVEDNIKKASDMKVMEDENHAFTASLLNLLSTYGIRPPVLDAYSISTSVKRLYHQLQWRIRSSQGYDFTQLNELEFLIKHIGLILNGPLKISHIDEVTIIQHSAPVQHDCIKHVEIGDILSTKKIRLKANIVGINTRTGNRLPDVISNSARPHGFRNPLPQDYNPHDVYMESPSSQSRFAWDHDMIDVRDASNATHTELQFSSNNNKLRDAEFTPLDVASTMHGPEAEVLPGIEGFQILGDAVPGSTLLACGFPTNGTSLCMFQWVRHLQDGTRHYIEGAKNPEYTVTADDVDKIIAVECIPMDETGHQGELVRHFANNQNKIACDPSMQQDIQSYISAGRAEFNVLLWRDSSEEWQPATITLKRFSYQVMVNKDIMIVEEKYTNEISIKVPQGISTQFVLTCSDGTSHPFATGGISQPSYTIADLRLRDVVVLIMRIFQAKALDDKRKVKIQSY